MPTAMNRLIILLSQPILRAFPPYSGQEDGQIIRRGVKFGVLDRVTQDVLIFPLVDKRGIPYGLMAFLI